MIGKFNRKILIQKVTVTTGETGQPVETWTTYREKWARLTYESGLERFEADKETAVNVVKFWIRYESTITEQMRVYYSGCYYDILHIEEVGRRQYLILKCQKKT
jgi:SPP1 family predicted phage head-tail adaptor